MNRLANPTLHPIPTDSQRTTAAASIATPLSASSSSSSTSVPPVHPVPPATEVDTSGDDEILRGLFVSRIKGGGPPKKRTAKPAASDSTDDDSLQTPLMVNEQTPLRVNE